MECDPRNNHHPIPFPLSQLLLTKSQNNCRPRLVIQVRTIQVRPIQVRAIHVRPPLSPLPSTSWSILTGSSLRNCNPPSTARPSRPLARCENRLRAHRNLPVEGQRVPHRRMTDTLLRRAKYSAILPAPHYNQRQPRFTWLTTIWLTKLPPLRLLLLRRRSRALRPSSRFRLTLATNLAQPNPVERLPRSY